MTVTTSTETTAPTFVLDYLGEGNWEVTAPNGVWTITADTADLTVEDITYFVEGPNHHHAEFWATTLTEVDQIIRTYGVDRRSAAKS